MSIFHQFMCKLIHEDDGQTLVEYSLIVSLIALTAIAGMTTMGVGVDGLYDLLETVANTLSGGGST